MFISGSAADDGDAAADAEWTGDGPGVEDDVGAGDAGGSHWAHGEEDYADEFPEDELLEGDEVRSCQAWAWMQGLAAHG